MKPSNTFIPDLDTLPATMPITVHIHSNCLIGLPFMDRSRLRSMITAPTHKILAKLILQEILGSCSDTTQLAPRLFALDGEVNIVTAASKNFTVKIPTSNSLSDFEFADFLKTICECCDACPNLITLEPGPDKCDNCYKQEQLQGVKKLECQDVAKTQGSEKDAKKIRQQEIERHVETLDTKDRASDKKQAYKRRRPSDIDMESLSPSPTSSSSSSSSNSSASEHFAKIPRKSVEESVSTTSRHSQAHAVTTTSTSGKWKIEATFLIARVGNNALFISFSCISIEFNTNEREAISFETDTNA